MPNHLIMKQESIKLELQKSLINHIDNH